MYRFRYTASVNVVREIRERSGLTTSELARRAATSRPNVTAYEHDRQQPTWPVVQRLAAAAGCAISVNGPVRRPETERSRRLGIAVAAKLDRRPRRCARQGTRPGWPDYGPITRPDAQTSGSTVGISS